MTKNSSLVAGSTRRADRRLVEKPPRLLIKMYTNVWVPFRRLITKVYNREKKKCFEPAEQILNLVLVFERER